MTIFKSHQVNLDPYPWLCDYEIDGQPVRSFFDGHGRYTWAPRHEQFDTPVNRVLVLFRRDAEHNGIEAALEYDWPTNSVASSAEEIDHARRVLTRLANWVVK